MVANRARTPEPSRFPDQLFTDWTQVPVVLS